MNPAARSWDERLEALWACLPAEEPIRFCIRMAELVGELQQDNPIGFFELACSQDSTGHSDLAIPLYRSALALGLSGLRRRRAVIHLASSLRNVGDATEAVALLESESLQPDDELSGAVVAFRALALCDLGREREGLSIALLASSKVLPRYNASLGRYAVELLQGKDEGSAD